MMLMKEKLRYWAFICLFVFFGTDALFSQITLDLIPSFGGCADTESGFVNLTVSGGDGSYSYQWSNGSTAQDLFFVNVGVYSVTVTDGNGLQAVDSTEVVGPDVLELVETAFEFNCVDSALVSINVQGGNPPYDIQWSNGATGLESTLPSGNFSISVYDAMNCAAYYASEVPDSFYVDLIVFDETCNMECDGSIFTSVNGGSGPYTFEWEHGADTSYLFPLHSDTFVVSVTDGSGCVAYGTGIVDSPDPLEVDFTADTILCGDEPYADVTANVTGGIPPYTYVWSTGDTGTTVSDFPADSMLSLIVYDSVGCDVLDTFFHIQYDSLILEMTIFPDECGGTPDGLIFLDVSGGVGPYSYLWSNNSSGAFIFDVPAGDYSVTVTNEEGCVGVASGTVDLVNSPLEATIVTTKPSGCFESDGEIVVFMSGGVGPYTYSWSNGAIGNVLTGLSQGIYTVTINDPLNCPIVEEVDLNVYAALDVEISGAENICEEGDSVFLQANILEGVPPFEYSWNTGDTSLGIWVTEGGTYIFDLVDSLGCFGKDFVEIVDGSELIVELFYEGIDCAGDTDGIAWVNVYNETADLQVFWSTGDEGLVLDQIGAGVYTVTVVDAADCPQTFEFEIEEANPIEFDVVVEDDICGIYGGGTISVNVDDPSVEIEWSTGSNEFSIENLVSGTYSFVLTDTFGCNIDSSVTVVTNDSLELFLDPVDIGCYNNLGLINSYVEGGQGPYTYSWNTGDTIPNIAVPVSGDYFVTVTDANSCEAIAQVYVDDYPEIYVEFDVQNTSCGLSNGSIQSTVYGGFPPYTYTWSNGSDSSSITGLSPGEYFLLVTDANGCNSQNFGIITVEEGLDLTLSTSVMNPSCEDSGNGSIEVFASGGLAPYTYSWSMGLEGENFVDSLSAGSYTVTVCDSSGCCAEETVQLIDQGPELVLEDTFIVSPCTGESNGSISIDVTGGGTNSYLYNWNTGDTTAMVSNLGDGEYEVTVTDVSSGCFEVFNFVLDPILEPIYEVDSENSCFEGASGSASVEVIAGEGPFEIDWSNGSEEFYNDMLASGYYSFELTYANECFVQDSVYVGENNPDECIIEIVQAVTDCESQDGIITFDSSDFVSFEWSTGAVSDTLTGLSAGIYSLTATDIDGCASVCEVELTSLNSIGDFVWFDEDGDGIQDSEELGIEGVELILYDGLDIIGSTTTNAEGWYYFGGLQDNEYTIGVENVVNGLSLTQQNQGADEALDSDIDANTGLSESVILNGGICYEDLDIGYADTCIQVIDPGTIGYDQEICGFLNTPEMLVEVTPASGGNEPYEYLWLYTYTYGPVGSGTWFPIPGSNSPNYQPGPLPHTAYFIRCIRSEGCDSYIESNVVEIYVDPDIVSNISGPNYTCVDESIVLTAQDNGPGATYEWYLDGVLLDLPSDALTAVLTFGDVGFHEVELIVQRDDCMSESTKTFYVLDDLGLCSTGPNPGGDNNQGNNFFSDGPVEQTFSIIPTLIDQGDARIQLKGIDFENIASINIVNVNGINQKVEIEAFDSRNLSFGTSELSSGVYLMNVLLDNGLSLSQKFIIVH